MNDLVYTYDETNGMKAVGNGDGIYYNQRSFSKGQNLVMTPNISGQELSYTMVKWFVPYSDNIINYDEGAPNPAENIARYYFMPYVDSVFDDANPVPNTVLLKNIDDGFYFGSSSNTLMELGTDNFDLIALNSMLKEDAPIPLYAAIIKTDINGNPIVEEDNLGNIIYQYVAITNTGSGSGHSISSTIYVDNLKFFIKDGETFKESGANNMLSIEKGKVETIYLSNIDVSDTQTVLVENVYNEQNQIVFADIIDKQRNSMIALQNYYDNFASKKAYYVTIPEGMDDYPTENSYQVSVDEMTKWDNVIALEITCKGVQQGVNSESIKYIFTYYLSTDILNSSRDIYPPISTAVNKIYFTNVKTDNWGVFQLDGNIPQSS